MFLIFKTIIYLTQIFYYIWSYFQFFPRKRNWAKKDQGHSSGHPKYN